MSGYLYSASSPVTYSDPTGAMMEGEVVEEAIHIAESPEPQPPAIIQEPLSPVLPPDEITIPSQTQILLPDASQRPQEIERLNHTIYRYHGAVKEQEAAAQELKTIRDKAKQQERIYNSKRTIKHYWINQLKVRSDELSRAMRIDTLQRAVQTYDISSKEELELRIVMRAPASSTMPKEFVDLSGEQPQPQVSHAPKPTPHASEVAPVDYSAYAHRQRIKQRIHPYYPGTILRQPSHSATTSSQMEEPHP